MNLRIQHTLHPRLGDKDLVNPIKTQKNIHKKKFQWAAFLFKLALTYHNPENPFCVFCTERIVLLSEIEPFAAIVENLAMLNFQAILQTVVGRWKYS